MKFNKQILILIAITLVGFTFRFYRISDTPPSLNWDEISHGYNAYSILKTGKDEWGIVMPHIFRAYGDYKLPLYVYLTTIPVFFLGLTSVAVRLISVLAGTLAIPAIYFFTKELFTAKEQTTSLLRLPLISALLLAFTPWHFFISRPALEANLSLTLIITGFYFLLKSTRSILFLVPGSLFLSLSLHTYNTARIFVPLLLIAFFIIYKPKYKMSIATALSSLIAIAAISLVAYQTFTGTGLARYDKLAILSPTAVYQIGQNRHNSQLSSFLSRLVYNRPVYFIKEVTQNYLGYFSPRFFWQSSGSQTQFAIPGQNLFGLPIFILSIIGLIYLITTNGDRRSNYFLLSWLFLSPLAASLTASPPQALRPNPLIPAIVILASYALYRFPRLLRLSSLIVVVIFFVSYLGIYFGSYRSVFSSSWQYGYQQAIYYLSSNSRNYTHVFVTKRYGEPHLFYAFYTSLPPQTLFNSQSSLRFEKSNWFWTDRINNIYFVNDWLIPHKTISTSLKLESGEDIPVSKALLITSPDHLPSNTIVVDTINYLDGQPAFVIAKFL